MTHSTLSMILTHGALHLTIAGRAHNIPRDSRVFPDVLKAVRSGQAGDVVLEIIEGERKRLARGIEMAQDLHMRGTQIFYKEQRLPPVMEHRLIEMHAEGFNLDHISAYMEKLLLNPSHRVVDQLYAYNEHAGSPINADGTFMAYKVVCGDYLDKHSRTFSNKPGERLSMPRNQVNDDPARLCAGGFHCCSFSYVGTFYRPGDRVMLVRVSPADVVSIPKDYNNTKMRVCAYEVVSEYENYAQDRGLDVLAMTQAVSADGKPFEITVQDTRYEPPFTETFDGLTAASTRFDELCDERPYRMILQNRDSGQLLLEHGEPAFDDGATEGIPDEPTWYRLMAHDSAGQRLLPGDYDSVSEAAIAALADDCSAFTRIEVIDQTGTTMKTIEN